MSPTTDTETREGAALATESASSSTSYTILDYLCGSVNIDIPEDAVIRICFDRDVDIHDDASDIERKTRNLLKADLLVWLVTGVSKRGSVSDTDNGWTHSDGGYTLTESDKSMFLKIANSIYSTYGEDTVGKSTIRIQSHGIRRADFSPDGIPQPYIISQ